MSAGIRAFPTFQFFINGNKVDEMKGASPQALENKVLGHKDKAGVSAFSGQGSALGGAAPAWDGVGMPPGTNDRMARLAKFGHIDEKKRSESGSSMDSKPVSVAAPQGVLRSSDQDDDDEEAAIARAIALSMAASDAPSSAIAVDASSTMDEMEIANDGDDDMVPVPVNEDHLSQVSRRALIALQTMSLHSSLIASVAGDGNSRCAGSERAGTWSNCRGGSVVDCRAPGRCRYRPGVPRAQERRLAQGTTPISMATIVQSHGQCNSCVEVSIHLHSPVVLCLKLAQNLVWCRLHCRRRRRQLVFRP